VDTLNSLAVEHPQKIFLLDTRNALSKFRSMICKVNAIEAAALFGKTITRNEDCSSDELRSYARGLFSRFQRPVFITRSRLGLLLIYKTFSEIVVPPVNHVLEIGFFVIASAGKGVYLSLGFRKQF
jgi:hypothetical protein